MNNTEEKDFNITHPELAELGEGWYYLENISGYEIEDVWNEKTERYNPQYKMIGFEKHFAKFVKNYEGKKEVKMGKQAYRTDGVPIGFMMPIFARDIS